MNEWQGCSLGLDVSVSRRTLRLVSSRRNFPMSRSRLGLEAERLGSRLGNEGLVSIPGYMSC